MSQTSKANEGHSDSSFHKEQLLLLPLHPLWSKFLLVIGNTEIWKSKKGAGVTKCDNEAQLEGHDNYQLL